MLLGEYPNIVECHENERNLSGPLVTSHHPTIRFLPDFLIVEMYYPFVEVYCIPHQLRY